jgi:hypothetical protein
MRGTLVCDNSRLSLPQMESQEREAKIIKLNAK